ncbi:MAG: YdcF family protein [Rhodobacteraceae bacterium]|nr:YdcF family protein [Paracoccaceae bacterium]
MRGIIRWAGRAVMAVVGLTVVTGAMVLGATWYFVENGYDPAALPKTDAIVVLSAGVKRDGGADIKSAARVEVGVDLWRAGVAPQLVFSGGLDPDTQQFYSEGMARHARALGAPDNVLTLETKAISTFENARFTIDILRERGWRRITLVTDDYHLLRSQALFWFWDRAGEVEVVSLAPAEGLWRTAARNRPWNLFRETLAYPFNTMKVIGQLALEATGGGAGRTIR